MASKKKRVKVSKKKTGKPIFTADILKRKDVKVGVLALVVVFASAAALLLAVSVSDNEPHPKLPEKTKSTGPVQIVDGKLFVNGQPFLIKGVGYNPLPIGRSPAYDFYRDPGILDRDFPLLRAMGANTIRVWGKVTHTKFLDKAYNNGVNPIYVIMGYHVEPSRVSDPTYRAAVAGDFREYVRLFKDHPAVLMWSPGNEVEYKIAHLYPGDENKIRDWYTLLNELAMVAYEVEGESYHPVMTSNWELTYVGNPSVSSDDNHMNFLDVWGATFYRGRSFGGAFDAHSMKSSKPILVTEFGIDAWDDRAGRENEAVQAMYAADLWNEIELAYADGKVLGGIYYSWSDEWWKMGDSSTQDLDGYENPNFPDGVMNEEWWGIMRVEKDDEGPDILTPREVYYTLQERWT